MTDAVLTRLRRESRDARKNRYSAYAIVLSTKRVIFCIVLMNFFLINVDLGRIRMERILKKASRYDSRRIYLHFLIGMNMVWIPIQESDRGEIVARPVAFAYAVSMPDGGGKPITAARAVANPAEVSGAPADAIVVDIHEVGP